MNWSVECADVLTWCEDYAAKIECGEAEKFHCILTDPSYGLGNNPDIEALLTAWMSGKDYDTGPGFMQRDWDQLPSPRYWAALRRVCHPGAYLFAFGGTRTADLLSVAIRLGGWERFDEIDSLSWCYGSGFPKSHNIGKAIDKAAGAEREVIGKRTDVNRGGGVGTFDDDAYVWQPEMDVTAPATDLAATWEGYGTALKPAHEPILCFRNPKRGTYAQNCVSTGAGGLWIDGSRVATGDKGLTSGGKPTGFNNPCYMSKDNDPRTERTLEHPQGRWPPNVCLSHVPPRPDGNGGWLPGCERLGVKRVRGDKRGATGGKVQIQPPGQNGIYGQFDGADRTPAYGSPDGTEAQVTYACVLACDPCGHQWTAEQRGACLECGGEARWACAAAEMAEMSGERKSGGHPNRPNQLKDSIEYQNTCYGRFGATKTRAISDTGTAARFYPQFSWQHEIAERLAGVVPFYYCAKSARRERDQGLEGFEARQSQQGCGGDFPIDDKGRVRDRFKVIARNHHPCCKPLSLLIWLSKLIAPPPEYAPRRLLVPFSGSGSEMCAALLSQNWDEVIGIEMEQSYVDIARARLRFWADWAARGYDDPAAILKAAKREETRREEAQMELL